MQFGFFVPYAGVGRSSRQRYRDAHEQIEFVDEAGFAHIWFPEHHFTQLTHAAAPLLSVVDAANRTTRIRLGTSVILSPYHHPLLLAEEIAMADHLSNGRLEVGFARGSYVHEYARLGIGGEIEAGERQTECLDILLGIWAHDDDFEYHGKYYSFPPTYTLPRPYQEPHPPLWMAARSADTMRFAIERGFGLHVSPLRQPMSRLIGQMNLLDALVQELGIGERPPIHLQVTTFVAEDRAEVLAAMDEVWRGHVMNDHAHHNAAGIRRGYPPETPLPSADVITAEELAERLMAGDPDTCVTKLRQYEAMGFDEFVVHLDFGLDQERMMRSLRLFAKEVMPHFPKTTVAPARRIPRDRNGSTVPRVAALSEVEVATARAYGLASEWRRWEVQDWLTHFNTEAARRQMYVFDFATAPRVKADAAGFVGGSGRLWMISDEGCPECGRPVIALFHRGDNDSPSALRAELRNELRTCNWHGSHAATALAVTQ